MGILADGLQGVGDFPGREARAQRAACAGVPSELSGTKIIDQYGCRGCHVIGGTGGTIGPNLDTVFERREEAWLRVQIANPRRHKPDSVMPDLGLTEEEIDAIIEVLRKSQ